MANQEAVGPRGVPQYPPPPSFHAPPSMWPTHSAGYMPIFHQIPTTGPPPCLPMGRRTLLGPPLMYTTPLPFQQPPGAVSASHTNTTFSPPVQQPLFGADSSAAEPSQAAQFARQDPLFLAAAEQKNQVGHKHKGNFLFVPNPSEQEIARNRAAQYADDLVAAEQKNQASHKHKGNFLFIPNPSEQEKARNRAAQYGDDLALRQAAAKAALNGIKLEAPPLVSSPSQSSQGGKAGFSFPSESGGKTGLCVNASAFAPVAGPSLSVQASSGSLFASSGASPKPDDDGASSTEKSLLAVTLDKLFPKAGGLYDEHIRKQQPAPASSSTWSSSPTTSIEVTPFGRIKRPLDIRPPDRKDSTGSQALELDPLVPEFTPMPAPGRPPSEADSHSTVFTETDTEEPIGCPHKDTVSVNVNTNNSTASAAEQTGSTRTFSASKCSLPDTDSQTDDDTTPTPCSHQAQEEAVNSKKAEGWSTWNWKADGNGDGSCRPCHEDPGAEDWEGTFSLSQRRAASLRHKSTQTEFSVTGERKKAGDRKKVAESSLSSRKVLELQAEVCQLRAQVCVNQLQRERFNLELDMFWWRSNFQPLVPSRASRTMALAQSRLQEVVLQINQIQIQRDHCLGMLKSGKELVEVPNFTVSLATGETILPSNTMGGNNLPFGPGTTDSSATPFLTPAASASLYPSTATVSTATLSQPSGADEGSCRKKQRLDVGEAPESSGEIPAPLETRTDRPGFRIGKVPFIPPAGCLLTSAGPLLLPGERELAAAVGQDVVVVTEPADLLHTPAACSSTAQSENAISGLSAVSTSDSLHKEKASENTLYASCAVSTSDGLHKEKASENTINASSAVSTSDSLQKGKASETETVGVTLTSESEQLPKIKERGHKGSVESPSGHAHKEEVLESEEKELSSEQEDKHRGQMSDNHDGEVSSGVTNNTPCVQRKLPEKSVESATACENVSSSEPSMCPVSLGTLSRGVGAQRQRSSKNEKEESHLAQELHAVANTKVKGETPAKKKLLSTEETSLDLINTDLKSELISRAKELSPARLDSRDSTDVDLNSETVEGREPVVKEEGSEELSADTDKSVEEDKAKCDEKLEDRSHAAGVSPTEQDSSEKKTGSDTEQDDGEKCGSDAQKPISHTDLRKDSEHQCSQKHNAHLPGSSQLSTEASSHGDNTLQSLSQERGMSLEDSPPLDASAEEAGNTDSTVGVRQAAQRKEGLAEMEQSVTLLTDLPSLPPDTDSETKNGTVCDNENPDLIEADEPAMEKAASEGSMAEDAVKIGKDLAVKQESKGERQKKTLHMFAPESDTDEEELSGSENGEVKATENGEVKVTENGKVKATENGEVKATENGEVKATDAAVNSIVACERESSTAVDQHPQEASNNMKNTAMSPPSKKTSVTSAEEAEVPGVALPAQAAVSDSSAVSHGGAVCEVLAQSENTTAAEDQVKDRLEKDTGEGEEECEMEESREGTLADQVFQSVSTKLRELYPTQCMDRQWLQRTAEEQTRLCLKQLNVPAEKGAVPSEGTPVSPPHAGGSPTTSLSLSPQQRRHLQQTLERAATEQSQSAAGPASLASSKESKRDIDQTQGLLTKRDEVLAQHKVTRHDSDQQQDLLTRMEEVQAQHKAAMERQDTTLRRAGEVQRTLVALNQRSLQDPADRQLAADIDNRLGEYQALLDRADTLQQEVSRLAQLHASLAMSQPHQPLAGATTAPHSLLQPGIKPAFPLPGFPPTPQQSAQLSSGLGSAFASVQSSFPAFTNMRPTLAAPFQFPSGFQLQGPAFSAFGAPWSAFSGLPATSLASTGAGSMAPLSANFMVPGFVRPFGGLPTTSVPSTALGSVSSLSAATPPHRFFSLRSSCPSSAVPHSTGSLANLSTTTTYVASGAGVPPSLGRSVTSSASISQRQEMKSLVNRAAKTTATPASVVRQRDEDERKQPQSNCAPGLSEAWAFDTDRSDKEPAPLSSILSSQKARPGCGTTCTSAGATEVLQGGVSVAVSKAKHADTAATPRIPRGFVFTASQPSTKENKNTAPTPTTTNNNNSNQKRQRPVSPPPTVVRSSPTKQAEPAKTSPQAFKALLPLKPIKVSTNRYAALASLGAGKPDTDGQKTVQPVCKLLSASFSASSDKAEEGEQTSRGRKTAASDTEGQGLSTKKRSLGAGDLDLGSDPAEGDTDDWQVSGSRRHRNRELRKKSSRQPQRKQGSTPPMTSVSRSSRSSSSSSETRGFTPVGGTGWSRSRSTTPTGVTGRSEARCTTPTGVAASVSTSRRTPPVASSRASPLPVAENWEDEIDPYPVRRGMISSGPTRLSCSSWTDPPPPSRPLLPGPPAPLKPVRTRCGITKRPPCLMSMAVKPANPELCRKGNWSSGAVSKDGRSVSSAPQFNNPSASAVSKDSTSPQFNNISASAVPPADNPSTNALPQLDNFSFSKKLPAACDAGSASGRQRLNVNKGFLGQLISNNEQANWGRQSPTKNRSRRNSLTQGVKTDTNGGDDRAESPAEEEWQKMGKKGKTEGARPKEPQQRVTQTASHAASPTPKLTAYRKLCLTIEKDFPHLKTDDVNCVIDEVKRSYGGHFHGKLFSDIMRDIRNVVMRSFPDRLRSPHQTMPVFTSMAMHDDLKKPVAHKKSEASWQSSTEGGSTLFKAMEEECCICLVEFTAACRYPLECGHTFHKQCIDKWVKEQGERTCPICRNIVLMVEDYPRLAKKDPSPFDKDFPKLGSELPKRGC